MTDPVRPPELRRVVRPMEELLTDLPVIVVRDSAVDALCHGAPLAVAGILEVDESVRKGRHVAVLTGKGEAVGFGHATMTAEEMVEAKEGIAAELARPRADGPGSHRYSLERLGIEPEAIHREFGWPSTIDA